MLNSLDDLNGKTVVVTGASGYIGTALVDSLVERSCNVIRVSRSPLLPQMKTRSINADVRSEGLWTEIIASADVIYHLAGNTSVYSAHNNPAESLNSTLLPLNHLIKAAYDQQRKPRVVFASTATVYGLTGLPFVNEDTAPRPITVYDMHKLFAEQQLALATEQGILQGVSLRLANVYGPSESCSFAIERGVLNSIAMRAMAGKDLYIFGDGNYLRDYVYISDVVSAFLLAGISSNIEGQSFNIASGNGTTLREAFETVTKITNRLTGKIVSVHSAPWPPTASLIEFRNFVGDSEKYTAATNWRPAIAFERGVEILLSNYLNLRSE
jgi:UDP-glucose 4-epimerase